MSTKKTERGEKLTADLAYWRRRLAGAPTMLELPLDRPRPSSRGARVARRRLDLSGAPVSGLTELGRRQGATLSMTMLAAFAALLSRRTGSRDVLVGVPTAGNTLVLRIDLDGDPSVTELLDRVRRTTLEAREHQDLPFEKLVEELVPRRDPAVPPLVQVTLASAGLASSGDLTLVLEESADSLAGELEYAAELFDATTIGRLAAQLKVLLAGMAADAETRVSRLPLLPPGERHLLLREWSTFSGSPPGGLSLHEYFTAQVKRTPEATALYTRQEGLSYHRLDTRTDRLAHALRRRGVVAGTVVGVAVDGAVAATHSLLAILKAGGTYLPLDLAQPQERLVFMLHDTAARLLVFQGERGARLAADPAAPGEVLELDERSLDTGSASAPLPRTSPLYPAYIIFTSGTTGRPKGVVLCHHHVVPYLLWSVEYFRFDSDTRALQTLSHAFDFGFMEVTSTLFAGGCLVCPEAEERGNPARLADLVEEHRINTIHATPSFFREIAALGRALPSLREVHMGAEAVSRALVREIAKVTGDRCRVYNSYGPTEASISCATLRLTGRPLDRSFPGATAPFGRVTGRSALYVLDPAGCPVGIGGPGELHIGGTGVALGYHGRPALSAERFVPDPFAADPGRRLYKSGDLVRTLADGRLEFLGRIDHQVKIRGYRVELGEVEAALTAHPRIRQAVATVCEDGEDRRLVACVTVTGELSQEEMRSDLRASLPEVMVPARFVVLETLPRTVTGKLDRNALARYAREALRSALPPASTPPQGPLEELLAQVCSEVLGVERIGRDDDFFELGGHSLLATRVTSRIQRSLGVELPLSVLFTAGTVAALARYLEDQELAVAPRTPRPEILRCAGTERPLSFAQERLWFLDRLLPGSPFYNVSLVLRLDGPLDARALAAALGEIRRRHEVFRTTFALRGRTPEQVVHPAGGLPIACVDLGGLAPEVGAAAALQVGLHEARRPFDLARGPLLRAFLARLGETSHRLFLNVHHIVIDDWSAEVLLDELEGLYPAFLAGSDAPARALQEPEVRYVDFAVWQRRWLQGEVLAGQLDYWRRQLRDLSVLELPFDRPRPTRRRHHGSVLGFRLPEDLHRRLVRFGRVHHATLFMTLLAAFQALLSRLSGQNDVAVGFPIANRNRPELQNVLGMFLNTLVLRGDLSEGPSLAELVSQTRKTSLGAYAHQDLPFERLVEELDPERESQSPLVQVMLVVLNARRRVRRPAPGLELRLETLPTGTSKFDLLLFVQEEEEGLQGHFEYDTDLFDPSTIRRWSRLWQTLLDAALRAPERRLEELAFLSRAEHHQSLVEWNDTTALRAPWRPVHRSFEDLVERYAEREAVVLGERRLSYRELNARANRLARHLRRLGLGPDEGVAVSLGRSPEMVVAVLAILKAGGFCVPLDPAYPAERRRFMLDDAAVRIVLADADSREGLGDVEALLVVLDADESETAHLASGDLVPVTHLDHLFYLIYTSGSTGRPKGVALPHRAFSNLIPWHLGNHLGGTRTLQFASLSFDASFCEMFTCWLSGGTLVLMEESLRRDVLALGRFLDQARIEKATFPVVVLEQLAQLVEAGSLPWPRALGEVISTGEQMRINDAVRSFFGRRPTVRLHNHYGPSETHVVTLYSLPAAPASWPGHPPIGRAIDNTRLVFADAHLRPLPIGVSGELLIGGAQLARGYLGRPGLTAERFLPDPTSAVPGERLYRSGDLSYVRPDGTIVFQGRLDHQVKVRGFRVELGEVESVLESHPAVQQAVAVAGSYAEPEKAGDVVLVAYLVCDPESREDAGVPALRAWLGERLPSYMVPDAWAVLDALPLNANGKVDRKALPRPERTGARQGFAAPKGAVEEILAGIWAQVLDVERIGRDDNFFELGGHSLLAVLLQSRVRAALDVELPVQSVFERPTVAALAGEVAGRGAAGPGPAAPPIRPAAERSRRPLSFGQQRLWWLDRVESGSPLYNFPLVLHFAGPVDPAVLAAALGEIVRRHEVLRTTFGDGEEPVEVIHPARRLRLPLVDHCALLPSSGAAAAERLSRREVRRAFDLESGPLFSAVLLRLGPEEHTLLFNVHHIAFDGASTGVLAAELAALYRAFREGHPSPLPELAVQYADFAVWQRGWLTGEVLEHQLDYWRRQLQGLSVLELGADRPRPARPGTRGGNVLFDLPAELGDRWRPLGREHGATLFMTFLAAFETLLHRVTGQRDLAVGFPVSLRARVELEALLGFFVNTLVLRSDLERCGADPSFAGLLDHTRRNALDAYAHQDLPFEKLVEELEPERAGRQPPLVQAVLVLLDTPPARDLAPGLAMSVGSLETATAKFDLTLGLEEKGGGGFRGLFEYSADLFDATTIRRLGRSFVEVLRAVVSDPTRRISELPFLAAPETHQLLVEWNDTGTLPSGEPSLLKLLAAQALARPGSTAVARGEETLTYAELDRRSNRLARALRDRGIGPDRLVAVYLERSPEMVVAMLAVLKAGGAYLPIDPVLPAARLAFQLADSGAAVVLTRLGLPEEVPRERVVDLGDPALAGASEEEVPESAGAGHLAYVIYTSGSTGEPKGVEISRGSLSRLVHWHLRAFALSPEDRTTHLAGLGFDASVWEIWPTLSAGARLEIPPEDVRLAPEALQAWLGERAVTVSFLPTPLAERLLDLDWPAGTPLRYMLTGGDRLRRTPPPGLPFTLINNYGPTENTVVASSGPVAATAVARVPSIGRPIDGVTVRLLDRGLRPLGVLASGELVLGGSGLGRGYLGRAGATAAAFVPDPWNERPGGRLYRTGDLARWLADGTIDFLGRRDQQVKIRGFRVELGEVEAVLRAHDAVAEAVVIVRRESPEDERLAAYVTAAGELSPSALRAHARSALPPYMVPATVTVLERLPLTPNGKVDRKVLAQIVPAATDAGAEPLEPPRDDLERDLLRIWAEILGLGEVGLDSSFFDLGGHSFLLPRVRMRLVPRFPHLTLVDLFHYPTVRSLAAFLRGGEVAPAAVRTTRAGTDAIAVVAMAGRFPGAADAEAFWRQVAEGAESLGVLDEQELLAAGEEAERLADPDYVRVGARLAGFDLFDPEFFAMSASEAAITDPQQRLFLECAWEALERAGWAGDTFPRPVGVYAGTAINTYLWHNLMKRPDALAALGGVQTLIGVDKDFVATRVAYKLNLTGPAVTVQAACSTSLVAVHFACRGLAEEECDMALAGGATVHVPQGVGYTYVADGILSPDGHCRAFDAEASGTVPNSGVGVVVLKRLADALADGDPVIAVIRGSAINNDGAAKVGYTAPSVDGQTAVIRRAVERSGIDPATVGYVECHGTGTRLGDPIEVAALKEVYGKGAGSCALSSVKTQVGHLDAAAGVAGLMRAALSLEHAVIPPNLHFRSPNPELGLDGKLYVPAEAHSWTAGDTPRRAAVSSFGIGGTNAHVVLEEAPRRTPSGPGRRFEPILLSAKTPAALDRACLHLAEHLEHRPELPLSDVAFTLHRGRKAFEHRRSLAAGDTAQAAALLRGGDPRRLAGGRAGVAPRLAFLFPGQGAQHPGMARDLYATEELFRQEVDACCAVLEAHLGLDLRQPILGRGDELEDTTLAQPALFVVEWALACLWRAWGLLPQGMLGHSLGEYVAATLAGVFERDRALVLVAARGRLMGSLPPGDMLAVTLGEDDVRARLVDGVELAAVNGPGDCVVSGPAAAVAALAAALAADGIPTRPLHTSHAFHSAMMEPILDAFRAEVERAKPQAAKLAFLSNLTGTWMVADEAAEADYWVRQTRNSVRFGDGLERLFELPDTVLLEVGPGRTLSSLVRRHPEGRKRVTVQSLGHPREDRHGLEAIVEAAARLWSAGVEVDPEAFWAGQERRRLVLPTYPLERRRCWIDPEPVAEAEAGVAADGAGEPAPASPVEAQIAEEWKVLLGVDPVGPDEAFFDLGGHSLLATQMANRLRQVFGVEIRADHILTVASTVAEQAAWIEARLAAAPEGDDGAAVIEPVPRNRELPLSFAQERLWFLEQLRPGESGYAAYFIHLALTGELDVEAMERTFTELERRHETLRTTFPSTGGKPVQVVAPASRHRLCRVDLSVLAGTARRREMSRVLEREQSRGYDLSRGPLFRTLLLRLAAGEHVLRMANHHIVFDGWTAGILVRELSELYESFVTGRPAKLPPLPVQYGDFAVWQRRWLQSEGFAAELDFWRRQLAPPDAYARVPLDRPRGQASRARSLPFRVPDATAQALRELARERRATLFMTLVAAFQVLLHHATGESEVAVGTPVANRNRPEIEGLVGFFVNTLVLRNRLDGESSFRALLTTVRGRTLDAFAHQDVPFEKLVEALQPDRSGKTQPLFQVLFALQNAPIPRFALHGLELGVFEDEADGDEGPKAERPALFDLSLGMGESGGELRGAWEYDAALFDAATAEGFRQGFLRLLDAIAADPDSRIDELESFSSEAADRFRTRREAMPPESSGGEDRELARQKLRAELAAERESLSTVQRELLARRLRRRGPGRAAREVKQD